MSSDEAPRGRGRSGYDEPSGSGGGNLSFHVKNGLFSLVFFV